ncbi:MAG: hypothetical protein IIB38_10940 [Candidatus Hydrogenedentes bacterium]|nr:hypothetical protein [Candidatus Hydrogenedentota bacterium]
MSKAQTAEWSWLAWARWKVKIPVNWRPLRVENRDSSGHLMLGDSEQATVQFKWWNPPTKGFDISRWLDKRLRSMGKKVRAEEEAPAAFRFDRSLWLPEVRTRKGAVSSVWYGYSARAPLVLEVVVNCGAGPEVRDLAKNLLLPSLDVSAADAPTRWSVYDTSFESPPGYTIYKSRLHLGAISLFLENGRRQLMLCQVYPGTAALAKKPLETWLDISSLKGKWHSSAAMQGPAAVKVGAFSGLERAVTKRRPFPLGRLAQRHCVAVVAHDQALDRLLLAEHISPDTTESKFVSNAVRSMNWAHRERNEA